MNKYSKEATVKPATLGDAASALFEATSEVAGEKVAAVRCSFNNALAKGKEIYGEVQDKTLTGVKAGDKFVRTNPYSAVGIAVGLGTLIGYLLARRKTRHE